MVRWHRADLSRMYVVLKGGVKVAMPNYYRNKIFDEDQKEIQRDTIRLLQERSERELERQFHKIYNNHNITFEEYKNNLKLGEYRQYYSAVNQKRQ